MQDLNDKVTGNTLTAAEWNEIPTELQNIIEDLGLTLSGADLNQLGKAITAYAGAGTFWSDSGSADTYVLGVIGGKQGLDTTAGLLAVHDGLLVRFRPGNANTGASTVNVGGLGVKDIVREDGTALSAGDLVTTKDAVIRYDQGADDFNLLDFALPPQQIANVPRGYIDGLTMSVGAADSGDHDTDIAVGLCRSDDNTQTLELTAALGKSIDVDWVAGGTPGTPAGGFPSGLTLAEDVYHVFLIRNTSTGAIDAGYDIVLNAANLLADATGYGNPRRIGSVITDSSFNIIAYTHLGDEFLLDVPVEDQNAVATSNTAALVGLTVPTEVQVRALITGRLFTDLTGGDVAVLITSPDQVDTDPTYAALGDIFNTSTLNDEDQTIHKAVRTNTSGQVRIRSGGTIDGGHTTSIVTHGWIDRRGRDE